MSDQPATADGEQRRAAATLDEIGLFRRFHMRLTMLFGVAAFAALAIMAFAQYKITVDSEIEGLRTRLMVIATALSSGVDGDAVQAVPLDATELTPAHEAALAAFRRLEMVDGDVDSIYILRPTQEPGKLRFFIDAARDSEQGEPGELYDATGLDVMIAGLHQPIVEPEPVADAFGLTMAGYAPVRNSAGESVGVLGVDVKARRIEEIERSLLRTTAAIFAATAVLLGLVGWPVGRGVRSLLEQVIEATTAIASGKLRTRLTLERRDEFGVMGRHFDQMAAGLEDRELIRDVFGRYVSESVARTLLASGEARNLGGEEREVTVLFSDLRGYSTISEHLAPTQVVNLLNAYLGAMNVIIDEHGGCVIEFLGDAILAVFGAPVAQEDHPEAAVRCALAMQRRLVELNEEWEQSGLAQLWQAAGLERLAERIGVHTGRVVAGNLGSESRMKYAVIGDTVNVAARLEALNKLLRTEILISDEVRARLSEGLQWRAVAQGEHRVKGRDQVVAVFSL